MVADPLGIQTSYDDYVDIPPSVVDTNHANHGGLEGPEHLMDHHYGLGMDSPENELRKRKNSASSPPKTKVVNKMTAKKLKSDLMDREASGKQQLKKAVVELLVYVIYLGILTVAAFAMTSSKMYYMTKAMSDLFITNAPGALKAYTDLATMEDIWDYFDNQLLDGLYWNDSLLEDDLQYPSIYYENYLMGQPRLRTLRVTNASCTVVDSFKREIKQCYGPYSKNKEDKTSFGPANSPAYIYTESSVLKAGNFWGAVSNYGGGGFVQNLSLADVVESQQLIDSLKSNRWIDRGTRVLFVDFTTYNPNLNLYCALKLVIELPASGGVLTSYAFNPMKLIRYVTNFDFFVLACEAIFCAFTIFYIFQDLLELIKLRLSYFFSIWNLLDLTVIALSIVVIFYNIKLLLKVNANIDVLTDMNDDYLEMHEFVHLSCMANDWTAILVFTAWLKLFKYISFNKTMNQLSATLQRSAKDIGAFAIMFLIFFFAYTQAGFLIFGTQVYDYSSFSLSAFALFRTILGDFDFRSLQMANRIIGPIFFLTYVFFVFFVLLNMFLAIINDAYIEVKKEVSNQQETANTLSNYVQNTGYSVLRKFGLAQKASAVELTSNYQIWRQKLLKCGYSEREINESFVKYDVNEKGEISSEQKQLVEHDLGKYVYGQQNEADALSDKKIFEIQKVDKRVDRIEVNLGAIADRLTEIALNLEKVELNQTMKYLDRIYGESENNYNKFD